MKARRCARISDIDRVLSTCGPLHHSVALILTRSRRWLERLPRRIINVNAHITLQTTQSTLLHSGPLTLSLAGHRQMSSNKCDRYCPSDRRQICRYWSSRRIRCHGRDWIVDCYGKDCKYLCEWVTWTLPRGTHSIYIVLLVPKFASVKASGVDPVLLLSIHPNPLFRNLQDVDCFFQRQRIVCGR